MQLAETASAENIAISSKSASVKATEDGLHPRLVARGIIPDSGANALIQNALVGKADGIFALGSVRC